MLGVVLTLCSAGCNAQDSVGRDVLASAEDSGVATSAGTGLVAGSDGAGAAAAGTHATAGVVATQTDAGVVDTIDGSMPGGAESPECDASGVWIGRLTTFSRDSVFNAVQTASNWYYYVIEQSGRDFTITGALDCGIQVSGSADVTINGATTEALLKPNDESGRHGTFYKDGDHCVFTLDRFYSTRGAPRTTYLPADTSSNPELSSLTPALPTAQSPAGSEDWDGDGNPGIAFNVSGLGTRHVVQRDWNEAASDADYPVALNADELVLRAHFDSEESILATTGGLGGLLQAASTPATDLKHRLRLRRLGRALSDAAVVSLHGADDVSTCFNVQDAMPHDPASM